MPRRSSRFAEGFLVAVIIAALAGCVDVPDGIRAQFAGPGANDRSNYRPGMHGAEPPPAAKASPPAASGADASVDAETEPSPNADADAGAV